MFFLPKYLNLASQNHDWQSLKPENDEYVCMIKPRYEILHDTDILAPIAIQQKRDDNDNTNTTR